MSTETNKALPTPDELRRWLEANGWVRHGKPRGHWVAYRHPGLGAWTDLPTNSEWYWYEGSVLMVLADVARSLAQANPVGFMEHLGRFRAAEDEGSKP